MKNLHSLTVLLPAEVDGIDSFETAVTISRTSSKQVGTNDLKRKVAKKYLGDERRHKELTVIVKRARP